MAIDLIPLAGCPADATTEQTALPAVTDGDVRPDVSLLKASMSIPPSDASSENSTAVLSTMGAGDLVDPLVNLDGAASNVLFMTHPDTTHPALATSEDSDDEDEDEDEDDFIPRGGPADPSRGPRKSPMDLVEAQKRKEQKEGQKKDQKKDQKKEQKEGQKK
ncbi:hypothetical protein C8Q78DRAFT_1079778 [Trametes maxima]|nr:hypothetical protein C8Q78DRAFT_1079778 [Trametes maxima]